MNFCFIFEYHVACRCIRAVWLEICGLISENENGLEYEADHGYWGGQGCMSLSACPFHTGGCIPSSEAIGLLY